MSHSQFHCTGRAYLDMHGLIFETSICYWQDQPGRSAGEPETARARARAPPRPPQPHPPPGGREGEGREGGSERASAARLAAGGPDVPGAGERTRQRRWRRRAALTDRPTERPVPPHGPGRRAHLGGGGAGRRGRFTRHPLPLRTAPMAAAAARGRGTGTPGGRAGAGSEIGRAHV